MGRCPKSFSCIQCIFRFLVTYCCLDFGHIGQKVDSYCSILKQVQNLTWYSLKGKILLLLDHATKYHCLNFGYIGKKVKILIVPFWNISRTWHSVLRGARLFFLLDHARSYTSTKSLPVYLTGCSWKVHPHWWILLPQILWELDEEFCCHWFPGGICFHRSSDSSLEVQSVVQQHWHHLGDC